MVTGLGRRRRLVVLREVVLVAVVTTLLVAMVAGRRGAVLASGLEALVAKDVGLLRGRGRVLLTAVAVGRLVSVGGGDEGALVVALWRHHLVGTWLGRGELELALLVAMLVVAVVTRLQLVQVEVGGVEPVVVLQGPAAVARPNRVARETVSGGLQVRVVGYGA